MGHIRCEDHAHIAPSGASGWHGAGPYITSVVRIVYSPQRHREHRELDDMINRMYLTNGLKGQQANSPGHRPGYRGHAASALKGQKHCSLLGFCPFRARVVTRPSTQGVALGYVLIALSGRIYPHKCPQGVALGYVLDGLSGRFYAGVSSLAEVEIQEYAPTRSIRHISF